MIKEKDPYCFGCQACVDICPMHCISFTDRINGYIYPKIDYSRCIKCNACEKVCQIYNQSASFRPTLQALFSHKKESVLNESSSGGVATAISDLALDEGYIVYGVAYDCNLTAQTIPISEKCELKRFQKSKYVKSYLNAVYSTIKKQLLSGKKILFIGLPCEVSALNLFLVKQYENLTTVSLFCGGNLSPVFFEKYIKYLEKKYRTKVIDINFRSKKHGSEILMTEILTKKGKIEIKPRDNFYLAILGSKFVRPSCLSCPYTINNIKSDIIIGDVFNTKRGKGTSIVISTKRGETLVKQLPKYGNFKKVEKINDLTARISIKDVPQFLYTDEFFSDVEKKSFKYAAYKHVINKWPISRKIYFNLPNSLKNLYVKWKRN